MGWAVGIAIIVIVLGVVLWLLLEDSLVRIDSGHLGLVLFKGAATDKVLLPGPHFVPTFRRKMVEVYPSLELAYRAGDSGAADPAEREYEHGGPPLVAVLGDNCSSTIAYTVRFRIDPGQLRQVHERFGNDGIWAAVRDGSSLAVRKGLSGEQVGVTDFFGPSRRELEALLSQTVGEVLAQDGFAMVLFALGDTDLGRTGAVIEATARARYELARELAESDTRQARARHDTQVQQLVGDSSYEAALRYRELEAWRDVAQTMIERHAVTRGTVGGPPARGPDTTSPIPPPDETTAQ